MKLGIVDLYQKYKCNFDLHLFTIIQLYMKLKSELLLLSEMAHHTKEGLCGQKIRSTFVSETFFDVQNYWVFGLLESIF